MKRKTSLYLLLASLLAICSCAEPEPIKSALFSMGEDGSKYYRIPALVKAADGALVAVADKRGDALGDLPNVITIVSKRSTDGGRTWSESAIVAQGDTAARIGYGDAVVASDEESGELIAIFSGNNGLWHSTDSNLIRTYCAISSDCGKSWGAVRDITDQVYGGVYGDSTRYGLFTGSGSALQLKYGDKQGRIMFVVAARNDAVWGGTMSNYAIYSDDHGKTWHASKNPACSNGDEAKVVELPNGEILMSIRNRDKGHRLFAKSTDGGETWSSATINSTLMDPACNGDIILHRYKGVDYLLHSLPASETTRENVTIYISSDYGTTWCKGKQIFEGYSAYSSLQSIDEKSIGIIVEEGKWDGGLPGEDGFNLTFYTVPFASLLPE